MDQPFSDLKNISRRHFLYESAAGLGGVALSTLLGGCFGSKAKELSMDPMFPRVPHFPGKAKSVIYLHMAGAPSQFETFDFKPELQKLHNQLCPQSLLEGKKFAFIRGTPKMLGPQASFKQYGESRAWVSEHLPHLSTVVDELSFLHAVNTDQFNHAPAQLLVHTGTRGWAGQALVHGSRMGWGLRTLTYPDLLC